MKQRKGTIGMGLSKLVLLIIGIIAALGILALVFKIVTLDDIKTIIKGGTDIPEKVKCSNSYNSFWCEHSKKEGNGWVPECLEYGTKGVQGENCNPKSHQPVNFEAGKYDYCAEDCRIQFCGNGLGRLESKCVACRNTGESCGGWFHKEEDECCDRTVNGKEVVRCDGSFLGGKGTCRKIK